MAMERMDPELAEFKVHTDELLVNMGPQHPSTHGVLRLVLRTDGEIVSEGTPHIGYLHRCAEKIGENVSPRQWLPYTDRMDYLAGMNMNLGWALTVEKLLGVKNLYEPANIDIVHHVQQGLREVDGAPRVLLRGHGQAHQGRDPLR